LTDFFEEIEENLRSDRYRQLFQKSWPWAAGIAVAALLIALGVWGWQTYTAREAARASEAYAAALDTLQKGDVNKAYSQFETAANSSSRGYKSLALMEQAGIRLQQNKSDEAATLFDHAAEAAPNNVVGDLARLKSAFALMDTAPYSAIEQRLTPLTDAKRPYHAAAREALAMAKLRAGKLKEARSDLQVLQLMPDASDSSRQRASVAILAIDSGAAANLDAVIKAAKTAPAPAPMPALPGLDQGGADAGAGQ
jgi:hypothetical protein